MIPVQQIGTAAALDWRMQPGNIFYAMSIETLLFPDREVVFGSKALPRFVFAPIVDYPLKGKNYAPMSSYEQAMYETDRANQMAMAGRVDGGLPMVRKLAYHCLMELVENYERKGLVTMDFKLDGRALTQEEIGQIYLAVLPPHITKPALTAIQNAKFERLDGVKVFKLEYIELKDGDGRLIQPHLPKLLDELSISYNANLPRHLVPLAQETQAAIRRAVETAIAWRRVEIDREAKEVNASRTNGGKGQTVFSNTVKAYATSLGLKLVDPVYVEMDAVAPAPPAAPAVDAVEIGRQIAHGMREAMTQPVAPPAIKEASKKTKKPEAKPE